MQNPDRLREIAAERIAASKLAAHRDLLMSALEGYVRFEISPKHKRFASRDERIHRALDAAELGESRLGGLPDLPPALEWPTFEGKKLPFLCQIDLAQISQLANNSFPPTGWLYAFALIHGDYPRPRPAAVLLYPGPRSQLTRAPQPSPTTIWSDWIGREVYEVITMVPLLSLDLNVDSISDALDEQGIDPDRARGVVHSAFRGSFGPETGHVASLFEEVTSEDGSASSLAADQGFEGKDWQSLLMIESVGSMGWGDCGSLYLLVPRHKLAKSDFSTVVPVIGSVC